MTHSLERPRRYHDPILTPRMRQIAPLICEGRTNAEIAYLLGNQEETIKSYVKRLLDYYQARNRTHLAAILVHQGIEP